MECLQVLLAMKKSKSADKQPRYNMRKLSIGFVSCMLGYMILLAPGTAFAAEAAVAEMPAIINTAPSEAIPTAVEETAAAAMPSEPSAETAAPATAAPDSAPVVPSAEPTALTGGSESTTDPTKDATATPSDTTDDTAKKDNEKYNPVAKTVFTADMDKTDPKQFIENIADLPTDATYAWVKEPTADAAGGEIIIKYNDGTEDRVQVVFDGADHAVLPAALVDTATREASGNIYTETNGYTDRKTNFQSLTFSPSLIDDVTLAGNQINFEIQFQQNIASSSSNWKINLQLDERIAKYISSVEADAAGLIYRHREFNRLTDTSGELTNIWQVNLIAESNGLFPGALWAKLLTTKNGIISLEKPLQEIVDEIGMDKLQSDRLFYRLYLTSVENNNQIITGMEDVGFFSTQFDKKLSQYEDVSPENQDWFRDSSLNVRYTKEAGANGRIIVDQRLIKGSSASAANFSYTNDAKDKEWQLYYKVDPRLVPYIDHIELIKMDGAGSVEADWSYPSNNNPVAIGRLDLSTTPGDNYGSGLFSSNNLKDQVQFQNSVFKQPVIRYLYVLKQPLNDILDQMRKDAAVDVGNPFGEDFLFDAALLDHSGRLIPHTDTTGFYHIQDIDGDNKADDTEIGGQTNPYIGIPDLRYAYEGEKEVIAHVLFDKNAGDGHSAVLKNAAGEEIARLDHLSSKNEQGLFVTENKELKFTLADPSKLGVAGSELKVEIISPKYTTPEVATALVKEAPKPVTEAIAIPQNKDVSADTALAKSGIVNADKMPQDTTYAWKANPDTASQGTKTGTVLVTVPDRDKPFEVQVPVKIIEALTANGKTITVIEGQEIKVPIKVVEYNKDTAKVEVKTDEGFTLNADGTISGTPIKRTDWGAKGTPTYEEQTKTIVARVINEATHEEVPATITIIILRDTDGDGNPDLDNADTKYPGGNYTPDADDDNDNVSDKDEETYHSDPKDKDSVPNATQYEPNKPAVKEGTHGTSFATDPITFDDTKTPGEVEHKDAQEAKVKTFEITDPDKVKGAVINQDGSITVPETVEPTRGEVSIPVKVTYEDGTEETIEIPVKVNQNTADKTNPGEGTTTGKPGSKGGDVQFGGDPIPGGSTITPNPSDGQPKVTIHVGGDGKVTIDIPDDAKPGQTYDIPVDITYPDKSKDKTTIKVTVEKEKENPGSTGGSSSTTGTDWFQLEGRVFHDVNRNGSLDPNETDISNVRVRLLQGNQTIATATTHSPYRFYVAAGNYTVEVDPSTLPAGAIATGDADGLTDGMIKVFLQHPVLSAHFAYFVDANGNGIEDSVEGINPDTTSTTSDRSAGGTDAPTIENNGPDMVAPISDVHPEAPADIQQGSAAVPAKDGKAVKTLLHKDDKSVPKTGGTAPWLYGALSLLAGLILRKKEEDEA